ncbi:MAG: hypothetical protein HN560_00020 [Anaerolineae bacterium]|jgi:hypothetical protein|nr:hypothetical protein [Anaerolineae bacterium]MBT7069704.1 hypothetical protein [Anaerolineae bacterium]MBT7599444.1 hypothetical protein [Anaerolineae bacterium]
MTKNWIGKTVIAIVLIGILIAGGFAVYRMGYVHGASADGASSLWMGRFDNMPHGGYFDSDDAESWMGEYPGSHMDGFSRMPFGRTTMGHSSFFSPFSFIFRFAFWGLLIWLIVKLVKGSKHGNGWQLSFTRKPVAEELQKEEE